MLCMQTNVQGVRGSPEAQTPSVHVVPVRGGLFKGAGMRFNRRLLVASQRGLGNAHAFVMCVKPCLMGCHLLFRH